MSLSALRAVMRRHARRAGIVPIVLPIGGGVAVHHAGPRDAHGFGGAVAGHAAQEIIDAQRREIREMREQLDGGSDLA